MNLCFSCEKQVQDDVQLRGRFICVNQRCIRFGLLSTIMIQPKPPEDKKELKKEEKKNDKDIPKH